MLPGFDWGPGLCLSELELLLEPCSELRVSMEPGSVCQCLWPLWKRSTCRVSPFAVFKKHMLHTNTNIHRGGRCKRS